MVSVLLILRLDVFWQILLKKEVNKIENGSYIPDGIIGNSNGQYLIQEGADNIDINAQTIDGKDTFHSMARVVLKI